LARVNPSLLLASKSAPLLIFPVADPTVFTSVSVCALAVESERLPLASSSVQYASRSLSSVLPVGLMVLTVAIIAPSEPGQV